MINHVKNLITRSDILGLVFVLAAPVALISAVNAPTALIRAAAIVAFVVIVAGAVVNAEADF